MAELTTLARPYAKAAFEVAKQQKELALWAESLELSAAVTENSKIKTLLDSPSLTSTQKCKSLLEVLGLADHKVFSNFLATLANNGRLTLLAEIKTLFLALKAQQEKSVDVSISSAVALPEELKNKFIEALKSRLDREVHLSTIVDDELIGGAVIRAGDTVIDGSIRGRLSKLSDSINA